MIESKAGCLRVTAPMVMDNARGLLDAGRDAFGDGRGRQVVDLAAVREADSSALAVMLGWLRATEGRGTQVVFANIPGSVRSLAELYGLIDLLPLA